MHSRLTFDAEPLRTQVHGTLIQQGDAGYEDARHIYNAMIDKHPALIVRCADVADVVQAVKFGRENGLPLAVRGGGHNGAGLALCDDGIVIDLSQMNSVRVDAEARTAHVGGGATWADVDNATHPFGLAAVSGIVSTTGVGGLTLGGGHGYLSRKYGLTIDNLLQAEVVLVDGRVVTASETENPDLFWALRGGGGNFGIVTSFVFRLHPVSTVIGGPMMWPLDQAAEVMRWYNDFSATAPTDLYGWLGLATVPPAPSFPEELHLKQVCIIVWCYTGDSAGADAVFAPIRELAPALDGVGKLPCPALQSLFDGLYPPGMQWYWKGAFVKELNDDAIAVHLDHFAKAPSLLSTMHLYPIDGAVHQVAEQDTAFAYRDATWSMVIAGIDPDPANEAGISAWAREYWTALRPYTAGGGYVNFMMEEGQERVRATYRDNYQRLVRVKNEFDPENLLRSNQNIDPRSAVGSAPSQFTG